MLVATAIVEQKDSSNVHSNSISAAGLVGFTSNDSLIALLRDENPSAGEREPKRISVYHTGRYAHRRKQLLQAGMAADPESKEDPTAAFLQHAPQLREFSLLDRSEISLHFQSDRR